ncbi:methyltransferase [Christensenellaceae bacterium OttesenSCG-928-K19]|nr:methyltransferase [Christensenellaceae bacterium OttesenSCG-928-K19]
MEIQYFVENYSTLPVADRKSYVSELTKSKELHKLYQLTKGEYARSATRILADMGARVADFVKENADGILHLLKSSDPKVRMHAAQIIGNTCAVEYLDELFYSIMHEDTMYALPSFLLAIGSSKAERAKKFLDEYTLRSDIDKHLDEEKAALTKALANFVSKSKVRVRITSNDIILLSTSNPNVTYSTFQKLGMKPKKFGDYIAVSKLNSFEDIYQTRAFNEAYIYLGKCTIQELPEFIAKRETAILQRTGVTGYRLEVKSVSHEVRLDIIKKCINSCTKLINTPSAYSIEIVLDINDGMVDVLLNPLADKRFSYRKKTISASINPGVAATVCAYASEFFDPDARVLDNFCGSGTLLYERGFYPHHTLTGVDINRHAIDAANENNRFSNHHPQFHHMDALKFTAKKYDEIITNMPFGLRVSNHTQNERLYRQYFAILPEILTSDGIAILYTQEKHLTERLVKMSNKFEILKRATFEAGGLFPAVYILGKTK